MSVPPDRSTEVVRAGLESDTTLHKRTKLKPYQICQLLTLCLSTTYFVYRGSFYKQSMDVPWDTHLPGAGQHVHGAF